MSNQVMADNVIEAVIACQQGPQASLTVLHYHVVAAAGTVLDSDLANALFSRWESNVQDWLPQTAQFRFVQVQILKPVKLMSVRSTMGPTDGANTSDGLPPQVSGLIWTKATEAKRQCRGRAYIGFPSASAYDPAEMTLSDTGAAILAGLAGLIGPSILLLPVGGGNQVSMNLLTSLTLAPDKAAVKQMGIRSIFATQRRRGMFGRPNPID